jgi:hypothetical protein
MTIRPHRDADAEGVTVITKTRDESSGYAGFTDAELIPHTDGSAESNPPGLLLLACQQAADEGGSTRVVDGARVSRARADQHPVRWITALGEHGLTDSQWVALAKPRRGGSSGQPPTGLRRASTRGSPPPSGGSEGHRPCGSGSSISAVHIELTAHEVPLGGVSAD